MLKSDMLKILYEILRLDLTKYVDKKISKRYFPASVRMIMVFELILDVTVLLFQGANKLVLSLHACLRTKSTEMMLSDILKNRGHS